MLDMLIIPSVLLPFIIFTLRVINMTLDTLRLLFVIRGRKIYTWILGILQSALWVVTITSVLDNLDNLWNLIGYAAGFATGNVLGMAIEGRLAVGYGDMRIISSTRGAAIAEAIRTAGYAATEFPGRGKDGTVSVISCSVKRRDIENVQRQVYEIDPEAFLTVEEIRPLHRGYWRG